MTNPATILVIFGTRPEAIKFFPVVRALLLLTASTVLAMPALADEALAKSKNCMACHAGYGWQDQRFDFSVQKNVDCLVCHDTTTTYRKLPGDAGHPVYERREFPPNSGKFVEAVDLSKVAQSVGKPSRSNCGACHFFGAGGNGAKHGDLDSSLQHPGKYLDVHMNEKGLNFSCTECHKTDSHQVSGSRYNLPAAPKGGAHIRGKADNEPTSCQACHSNKPHPAKSAMLNQHTEANKNGSDKKK